MEIDLDFKNEAYDLLDGAEEALLNFEKNEQTFEQTFKAVFRCFHSLKGAASMFGARDLEVIFHAMEEILASHATSQDLPKDLSEHFLHGIDCARKSLAGQAYEFIPYSKKDKIVSRPEIKEKKKNRGLVVIVEDEDLLREFIVHSLKILNFETADFPNPIKALEFIETNHPDLVITDLQMPQMNGMEFISRLRKKYSLLPVIITSAYVSKEVCMDALMQGASGILEKPFQHKQLVSQVELNIDRYRSYKLLSKSIQYLQYQFADLDEFLTSTGKMAIRDTLRDELKQILLEKRKLDTRFKS
jgi:DNA-binding response OmpR family regulator